MEFKNKKSVKTLLAYILTIVMLFGTVSINAIAQSVNDIPDDDKEELFIVIEDAEVPLAPMGDGQSWALLNLILSITSAILALMVGIRAITNKRREDEEEYKYEYEAVYAEYDDEKENRERLLQILAIPLLAIIGILLFIFTQDMRLPMVMTDWWTLVHVILNAGVILGYIFAYRKNKGKDKDEDEEQSMINTA